MLASQDRQFACLQAQGWEGLLLPVIFGHVVGQPVHFGFPAFPEGFIKLHSEVLQSLLLRFPQCQRILGQNQRNECPLDGLGPAQQGSLPPCTSALSGQVTLPPHRGVRRAPHNISPGKSFFLLTPNQGSPPTHPQNKMSACARRSWPEIPMWTGPGLLPWKLAGGGSRGAAASRELGTKENTRQGLWPHRPALPTPESHRLKRHRKEKYLLTTEGTLLCKWKYPQPVEDGRVGQRRYQQNTG